MIQVSFPVVHRPWTVVMLPHPTGMDGGIAQKAAYRAWMTENGVMPYEGAVLLSDRYILLEEDAIAFKLKFGL